MAAVNKIRINEELECLVGSEGNGPVVIAIGVPAGDDAIDKQVELKEIVARRRKYNFITAMIVLLSVVTSLGIIYREHCVQASQKFGADVKSTIHELALKQFLALQLIAVLNLVIWRKIKAANENGEVDRNFSFVAHTYFVATTMTQVWICVVILNQLSMIHDI